MEYFNRRWFERVDRLLCEHEEAPGLFQVSAAWMDEVGERIDALKGELTDVNVNANNGLDTHIIAINELYELYSELKAAVAVLQANCLGSTLKSDNVISDLYSYEARLSALERAALQGDGVREGVAVMATDSTCYRHIYGLSEHRAGEPYPRCQMCGHMPTPGLVAAALNINQLVIDAMPKSTPVARYKRVRECIQSDSVRGH